MKSQRGKDLYFTALKPATYVNNLVWRLRLRGRTPSKFRRGENGHVWLNIGSGAKPHRSFVNIDGNIMRWPEMWLDLRDGLPFPSQSVDGIYACHVLEHFYWKELRAVLRECLRVLRSRAGIRILVPSVEFAVQAYLRGDMTSFSDFPTSFRSLGGRFANFLFCDGQHRLAFDLSFAAEALNAAGFTRVERMEPRSSALFSSGILQELEPALGHIQSSLIVEARKGGEGT